MADDVVLNLGSGGSTVATDDISDRHFQLVKITLGALDDDDGPVSSSNRLPTDGNMQIGDADVGLTNTVPITITDTADAQVKPGDAANDAIRVNVVAGGGTGGTNMIDDAAFTPGSTAITPAGGMYRSVRDTVDDNDGGALAMNQSRGLFVTLEASDATEMGQGGGTEAAALRVTLANDSTGLLSVDDNGASLTVDAPLATPVNVQIGDGTDTALVQSTGELLVRPQGGEVDPNNSTAIALGGGAAFTGTATDVMDFASVSIQVFANVASATNGLSLEWSIDGTNWDVQDQHTISANEGEQFTVPRLANHFRVVYTNGAGAQATFRLETLLNPWPMTAEIEALDVDLADKDAAAVVRAVIAGKTPGGTYTNVQVSTGGNFKIDLEDIADTAIDVNTGNASAGTQRVVLANDQPTVTVDAPVATPVAVRLSDGTAFFEATDGAAHGASQVGLRMLGTDGTNDEQVSVDATGHLQIDVLTSALPSGAATAANQLADGHNVTVDNASGGSAVNIQDGGNIITVDGTVSVDLNAGTNTNEVVGDIAHGTGVGGNPVQVAYEARTTTPTAVDDGDVVRPQADDQGRVVHAGFAPRDLTAQGVITLSSTTETTLVAAAASTFHDLTHLSASNTSSTAVRVDIRDDTGGTVRFSMFLAADGGGFVMDFTQPFPATAINDNWTAQLSSGVTDVRVQALAVKRV
jgi:hypothetical protein